MLIKTMTAPQAMTIAVLRWILRSIAMQIKCAGLNILGMVSIKIEKTERSLRLVGVVAPTPRRAIPQIVPRINHQFGSGFAGLG
jgi:hypothetical protein